MLSGILLARKRSHSAGSRRIATARAARLVFHLFDAFDSLLDYSEIQDGRLSSLDGMALGFPLILDD